MSATTYKKFTINVAEDVWSELQHLANEMTGGSVTELVRQAVALQKFAWEHRDGELLIKRGDRIDRIVPAWWSK